MKLLAFFGLFLMSVAIGPNSNLALNSYRNSRHLKARRRSRPLRKIGRLMKSGKRKRVSAQQSAALMMKLQSQLKELMN